VRDVAQVLLDDGQPDFAFAADIPPTRTARGRSNLGAVNGYKTKIRGTHRQYPYARLMRKQAR
jgi:hypothetical protein